MSQLNYWACKNVKNEFSIERDDIVVMSHEITIKFGGYLRKGESIYVNEKSLVALYDHIVISGHLCVILDKLGQGAFGKVYKGFDYHSSKFIAIKSQPSVYAKLIARQSFATKKNGIGLLDPKSNVGPTFLRDGNGYFVIPLADMNFNDWVINKSSSNENKLIIDGLINICKDLIRLHTQGMVHMDLKMDNILVVNDKSYISDFGKVERINKIIPSAQGNYLNYPQCDPNYFSEYSKSAYYTVNKKFDYYSLGKIIKNVSSKIKDPRLQIELCNISKYLTCMEPKDRYPITKIIEYLDSISKNLHLL